jgi:hypothetical protein
MGGSNAVDILRLVVLDRDMQVKLAGAEALADLADPRGMTLLSQMFASGERGPFYTPARRGLLAIGEPAWDDLLNMARSSSHPASRSAMLLLSEQAVTEVMTTLLQVLTDNPNDSQMARELAIMTGVDFAMEAEPAREWWVWHDAERGKTALGWFVTAANKHVETSGALEFLAAGLTFTEADLADDGTERGAEALIEFLRLELPSHLQTRALRELRRILDEQRLTLPPKGRMRDDWCDKLHSRIPAVFEAKAHAADARERLKRPEPAPPEVAPDVEVDAAGGTEDAE